MARKLFRKFTPSRARLEGEKSSGWMRRIFGNPNVWHLNRHSVARGLAVGMFWAWMPMPMQSPFACFFTWKLRGNVPLAFACCWISNPITIVPAIWLCYQIGLIVTWSEPTGFLGQIKLTMQQIDEQGFLTGMKSLFGFMWGNLGVVYPFLIGSLVFSTLTALVAYFGTHALWRWSLIRRWKKRGHKVNCRECHKPLPNEKEMSCPHCQAPSPHRTRIGLGLGAIARLARKQSINATTTGG